MEQKRYPFYKLLIYWVFISVLPQFLQLTREDAIGTYLKIVLFGTFVVIVLFYLLRHNPIAVSYNSFVMAGAFVLLQVFSNFIVNKNAGMDVYISIVCSIVYYIAFCCIFENETISMEQLLKISSVFVIMTLYVCIMNFVLYRDQMIPLLTTYNADAYNIDSVFFNRTNCASFLLVGIIILYLRIRFNVGRKIFNILVLLLAAFNLLLTLARTSIFTLVIFVILAFITKNKNRRLQSIFALIAICIALFIVLKESGALDYVIQVVIRPESGVTHRDMIWTNILNDIKGADFSQFLFGFGYAYHREAHNTIIGTFTKFGLLGSALYLAVYIKTIGKIVYIIKRERDMGIYFLCVFLAFVATSFTEEFTPFMSTSMSVIWTFCAVLLPMYYANYVREKYDYRRN